MHKLLAIRSNKHCRRGDWFFCEEIGEPVFRARMRGPKLVQTSKVGLPFDFIADCVIEPGFTVPKRAITNRRIPTQQAAVQEIADFQSDNEEIIEGELERRGREANPTHTGRKE